MNLQITEEQSLLLDAFDKLFRRESTPERVQAADKTTGFDDALWRDLVEMGAPLLRTRESCGGSAGSLLDAILVAEEAGKHLASVPLIESLITGRILGELGGEVADGWLARIARGDAIVTLALHDPAIHNTQLVPGASVADGVLVLDGDVVSLACFNARPPQLANTGSLPLAEVVLKGPGAVGNTIHIASGSAARGVFLAGVEEWKLLTAATLSSLSRKALEDAAVYSCDRTAFDRQIGSYQGLAHPMADAVTEVEGARQLVWWTAWSLARKTGNSAALVSMAYWWATHAAGRATMQAMRVFGGYGVSMECLAQVQYRRGRALSLLLGDPRDELRRAADRLFAPEQHHPLPEAGEFPLDFGLGEAAQACAAKARQFFEENMTPDLKEFSHRTGDGYEPEFHRKLAKAGLIFTDWPAEYGGQGLGGAEMSALYRVFGEYGWWLTVPNVTRMVGTMLMHFGTEDARREILPQAAAGEVNFALGYSEPSCGSDVFAARTRAERDGDDWIINGQKMFTSQGHLAQYCLMVTRTEPKAAKHAGLTLFLLPLNQPGYECSEVKTLGGERTNVTFYSDMRVPDKYRIGEVNGGAKVLAAALTLEQSGGDFYLIVLKRLYRDGCAWARSANRAGRPAMNDDDVCLALARLRAHIEILDAMTRSAIWSRAAKRPLKYHGPMTKLFGSEAIVRCSAELMELAAPASLLQGDSPLGRIELESRRSMAGTIYAGSSEIQRSIIAETALGMPRTRS